MTYFIRRFARLDFFPASWRIPCLVVLGISAGMGLVVAHISRASSYLSDEPKVCVNCHVMNTAYLTWQNSSHARVATCNDCHIPNEGLLRRYAFKAKDGFWHSTVFTMRWEPQVIQLSAKAVPVVEENCRRCHEPLIEAVHLAVPDKGEHRCWDCHREVPHGRVRGLSATLQMLRPELPPIGLHPIDSTGTSLVNRKNGNQKKGDQE
ncbi:MAG: cytochrome c nitrite reductase small subunit [Candidatus Loosdrechtia sp.]|uniref:cytochrome c nitrite reductase small subunit n=1 Tax=Candidatus Loosdrechtia sp. TaxID=3101272 RepID=UPI003A6FECB2|nr:MAG: cytochrome c nitrite reductase small subunit [Candidatus Jettenia sp. AMX2]